MDVREDDVSTQHRQENSASRSHGDSEISEGDVPQRLDAHARADNEMVYSREESTSQPCDGLREDEEMACIHQGDIVQPDAHE